MDVETFAWDRHGWSVPSLPALDSDRTLIIAFAAPELGRAGAPWRQLRAAYPRSIMLGCSTSGEILGTRVADGTVSVAVVRFERGRLVGASASVQRSDQSFGAGVELARRLLRPDLRGIIVLSDGLRVSGSELVRGLSTYVPRSVVVTGGLAGDGVRYQNTWVLGSGEPRSGLVGAVGIYGDGVRIGHGSRGGWETFGPERIVTRSAGNVLYELDGRPALVVYKEHLGERAAGLPGSAFRFPLALRAGFHDKSLVRTVRSVDEAGQSLTFAGDIPDGYRAHLMAGSSDHLVQGASDAAAMTSSGSGAGEDDQVLAIAISCVGRRLVLGHRTAEEIEATLEALPPGTRQVGFYSYGEIAPFSNRSCDLHNQTMTLTTISER
jgi:hypothetical protein